MKNIIFAIFTLVIAGLSLQSCKNEDQSIIEIYGSYTEPNVVAPTNGQLIFITGTNAELKWESTDSDGDAALCDVYFGTSEVPELFKANHNQLKITVPVEEGVTYYWYVVMKDAKGIKTTGKISHFTVAVNYDINNFVGAFDCNEPGYKHYNVNFTKISSDTIENDNFWDSGWAVKYVFDSKGEVNIVPVSYTDAGKVYSITGQGKFNNTAKTFYVDYEVKRDGVSYDVNTHTFTKK